MPALLQIINRESGLFLKLKPNTPVKRARVIQRLELELIQPHMTQMPMLRGEVGARALRNPVGREGGAARDFACGGG